MNRDSFYEGSENYDFEGLGKELEAKPMTPSHIRNLGLSENGLTFKNNLKELEETPPNIVIARCVKDTSFVQNYFKTQTMKKKKRYVMGLGMYQQLHYNLDKKHKILVPDSVKFNNVFRPYKGQELDKRTLLVWRTGGIGDLGFIQPNLRYLKEIYPTCKIYFACGPQYQSMVDNWDCVDELVDLPFPMSYLLRADYHALFEGVIERCREAHTINAYNLFSMWMGLNLPDERLIPINKPKPDRVNASKGVLKNWGVKEKEFTLVQLRASSLIRTPRPEVWVCIINTLIDMGETVVITDAPHAAGTVDAFIKMLDKPEKVFNFAHFSKTLDYTIALTSLAKSVVGTDSSLTHLAASMQIPILGIFGPFPGYIRLKTYKNCDWIDVREECSPCYLHGHLPCPNHRGGHGKCYDNLSIPLFVEKYQKLMSEVYGDLTLVKD